MENRSDYEKYVENSPVIKAALAAVDDEQQKEAIIKAAKDYANKIADAFVPVIKRIKADPEFATKLREELNKKKN